jgi:hypothetical protein
MSLKEEAEKSMRRLTQHPVGERKAHGPFVCRFQRRREEREKLYVASS